MFCTHPELLVSLMMCPKMEVSSSPSLSLPPSPSSLSVSSRALSNQPTGPTKDHEAILLYGSEQYSLYSGYAWNLRFGGDFVDALPKSRFLLSFSFFVCPPPPFFFSPPAP